MHKDCVVSVVMMYCPRVAGETVRTVFEATRQPPEVLARVWDLADVSRDGRLDEQEFCLACHLLRLATTG